MISCSEIDMRDVNAVVSEWMISWYYEKAKDLDNKNVINLWMDTRILHVVNKCKLESKKEDEGKIYSDL